MKLLRNITLTLFFTLFVGQIQAKDTPITEQELPQEAQAFLKKYFPKEKVSYVIKDSDFLNTEYDVYLDNATEIEFNEKGQWIEVDGKHRAIPTGFIPNKIKTYLANKFPNTSVSKIEKKSRKYEVELNGDIELEFSLNGDFLKMD